MFCTKCGKKVMDGSKFCIYCGNLLKTQPEPKAEPVWTPPVLKKPEEKKIEGRIVLQDLEKPTNLYVCESTDSGILGRSAEQCCMVIENEKSVSRKHCQFSCHEDGWYVEDLGSHNHTILNGNVITSPMAVKAGDRLNLGAVKLVVAEAEFVEKSEVTPKQDNLSEQVWFCTNCGSEMSEKCQFCTNCGAARE